MVSLYTLSVLISHKLYNVYVPQSILDMYTCSVTYEMLHTYLCGLDESTEILHSSLNLLFCRVLVDGQV